MHKNILLCVGITILFLGLAVAPITQGLVNEISNHPISKGNTLYVGGSGPGNYSSITEAVRNSVDGDTVFVYDDSAPYYENVGINKSINLIGENKDTTIIDGDGKKFVFEISASNVIITGFTIQNASGGKTFDYGQYSGVYFGAVVGFEAENITIRDNIIRNNPSEGLLFVKSDNNVISENLIEDNGKRGIRFFIDGHGTIITNNIVQKNKVGIQTVHGDAKLITIQKNTIIDNSDLGILLEDPHFSIVTKNNFEGNNLNAKINLFGNYDVLPFDGFLELIRVLILSMSIIIRNNYWDRGRVLPYVIDVDITIYGFFNWVPTLKNKFFKLDKNPAQEPYDI